jgi:hypothetical protein
MRGLTRTAPLRAGVAIGVVVAVFSACGQSQRKDSASDDHAGDAGTSSGGSASGGSAGATGGSAANGGSQATGGNTSGGGSGGTTGGSGGATAGSGGTTGGSGGATAGSGGGGGGDAGVECVDGCSMECTCPRGTGFFALVCVLPGDQLCAGPPPPPANCSTDADCADAGALNICMPGYCDVPRCTYGCATARNCTVGEVCGADGHCAPKSCAAGEECGPNYRCDGAGLCERTPCERSADCDDFCVNQFCYDTEGHCGDPSAP